MTNPETIQVVDKEEEVETKKDQLLVTFILDKSGSMESIQKEAVAFFNEQLQVIKKEAENVPTKVSLVTFSTQVDKELFWNKDSNDVEELNLEAYRPSGMTAMYDAVGNTVTRILHSEEAKDENTAILIVVISDGMENSSKYFDAKKIASLVSEAEQTKRWTFTYFGANQDLAQVSEALNIKAGNMYEFEANAKGMGDISMASTRGLSSLYSSVKLGAYSVDNFCTTDTTEENKEDKQ